MSTQLSQELGDFHRFLGEKLANEGSDLSPEQALDEWRRLHPPTDVFEEDVAAIQEALDDKANGDKGISFEEFDRDFRQRHQLP
jgi:hypothetical protein